MNRQDYFEHEKLEVYRLALDFLRWTQSLDFKGLAWLRNQLQRSAGSVVLNLGEGAHQWTRGIKRKHYRIALASCGEAATALDAAEALGVRGACDGRPRVAQMARMLRGLAR